MKDTLSPEYWNSRYKENQIGWNIGAISEPLKEYFDQLTNKDLIILIPGCGLAYEGEYLFKKGFQNVHLLDFAEESREGFMKRVDGFPEDQFHVEDFFDHKGKYDLIIEQTMFCAIDPSLREKYAEKAASLLVPGGKLVGVLFNRTFEGGPPFGGTKEEYETYFSKYFSDVHIDECYNSIKPRSGTELFIRLKL